MFQELQITGEILLSAARKDNFINVQAYIVAGAPINFQDPTTGETVLHIAVRFKNTSLIRFLCNREDIDITLKNKDGNTADQITEDQTIKDIILSKEKYASLRNAVMEPEPTSTTTYTEYPQNKGLIDNRDKSFTDIVNERCGNCIIL